MAENQIEATGVGAPFVDYIIEVSDEFLKQLAGAKGGMEVVDYSTLKKIIEHSGSKAKVFAGGSSANTIRGLAQLGHRTALVGRVGDDEPGKMLSRNLSDLNITSYLIQTETPTAQAVCLITSDGERTMRAFLGASQELVGADMQPKYFEGVKLVHIEGYSLLKDALAQRSMELAKAAGAKVSFDLGSFEVVRMFKEPIVNLLSRYVDVVFANRDEIQALTQLDPEKGCKVLADICETVVVLLGAEGCLVAQGKKQVHIPAKKVNAIDTTGAGDLFASGFLHGYLEGRPIEESATFGTIMGAAIVQVSGVELPSHVWTDVRANIKNSKK